MFDELVKALTDLRDAVQRAHVDGDGRVRDCPVCRALDNADAVLARAAHAAAAQKLEVQP